MNKLILFLIIFSVYVFCQPTNTLNRDITKEEITAHINYLASDELGGRFSGTDEAFTAAKYIMNEFKSYGLKPLFNNEYFQEFSFISDIKLAGKNEIIFNINGKKNILKYDVDFVTAPFARIANAKGELVFIGYGISAPKLSYDDYEGIDVTGKVVVILRYSPEYDNPHSEFDEYSSFRYKTKIAQEKGAAGIIFVNGFAPKNENDELIQFKYDRVSGFKDFPVVHIKRNYIDDILKDYGFTLQSYQDSITKSKTPLSFKTKNISVELSTGVEEVQAICRNVGGFIEGIDPNLKNEYVVIGAHYDHLGLGYHGSLYRGTEMLIHNGADDNASGTTGMLELAEYFALSKNNKRTIIFLGFSGEELGLLGSNHFVNHSPIPTEQMVTMINLDMVGRLNDKYELIVYGTGTSPNWKDILNNKNSYGLNLTFNDEGYGPSDHSSFYAKNIPVLFFFTGTHADYHRPTDDADKINTVGMENLLRFVSEVAAEIINLPEKPLYVNVPRKDGGRMGGWKVYVGTIPDYAHTGEGFKISGVNDGSPAAKGGMQAGDIMMSFGGKKINNIYDYVYALQEYAPGDIVEVIVLRNGENITLNLELGAR